MKTPNLALCGVILVSLAASAAEPKVVVDSAIASLFAGQNALTNLVVGVVHGGESARFRFGEGGKPAAWVDSEEFEIASVTKPFTGLLLARMVSERMLAYEDAVCACAEGTTTGTCFNGVPITFLQLVTHYSGLPVQPADHKGGRYTAADFKRFLSGYQLRRAPGSRFEYSTAGYSLLGILLTERAGAGSFEEHLTAEVLRPLRLEHTRFPRVGDAANYAGPSGGLASTVDDLLRFVALNVDPDKAGRLADAIRLTHLSDPSLKSIPPSVSARGWHVIQPLGYHWHTGVTSNTRVFVAFDLKTGNGVTLFARGSFPASDARLEMAGFSILGALGAGDK